MTSPKITSLSFGELEKKINWKLVKVEFNKKDIQGKFLVIFYSCYVNDKSESVKFRAKAEIGNLKGVYAEMTVDSLQNDIQEIIDDHCGQGKYTTIIDSLNYENSMSSHNVSFLDFTSTISTKREKNSNVSW